jgi:glycerate kinase
VSARISGAPILLAPDGFEGALSAEQVAAAIGRGLAGAGRSIDYCPVVDGGAGVRATLAALDFDQRLRAARAVVVGAGTMDRSTLEGKLTFEVAVRARQGGVPAYAVVARNALDAFDMRIMDLQVVLEASTEDELEAAGRTLAGYI